MSVVPKPIEVNASLQSVLDTFDVSNSDLKKVMHLLGEQMNMGLAPETQPQSDVKMFPTYVQQLPSGEEAGSYLALDLGGTNFRVLLITLHPSVPGQPPSPPKIDSEVFPIPKSIMLGSGIHLFDHIVNCIINFVSKFVSITPSLKDKVLPLGFTFSFPCRQEALNVAILTSWTKGFNCDGVVGENVVRLLHEARDRSWEQEKQPFSFNCVALINDTVGCLMSCAHEHPQTRVGLILGTGTNACYMEKVAKVGTFNSESHSGDSPTNDGVIINMEWGAFGSNGCLNFCRTSYDHHLDKHSINSGKQIFEKMISGMYMGETVRLIMIDLIYSGVLLENCHSDSNHNDEILKPDCFLTKYLSEIEAEYPTSIEPIMLILQELGFDNATEKDCHIVHSICKAVSTRAAHLAAAGVACLLNIIDEEHAVVGVDGSLYRYHPHFKNLMTQKIKTLLTNQNHTFELVLSHDGSGKGAAIVAASASVP